MPTISLCMIVKNEEAVLDRCLSSIASLMDEIIIVDTGSTDRTKEIAARYTDQIYDFPWQNDFSAARNFSFSKAHMDYIYAADADEVVDPVNQERFFALKQTLLPEIEIVQMKYITANEFNTVMNIRNEYRPKLYKRLRSFRWIDPIHETVQTEPLVFNSDIEILHCPQSLHSKRDFQVFLQTASRGERLSDKLHTMYAMELYISGSDEDFKASLPVFHATLDDPDASGDRRLQALCILSRCMRIGNSISDFFKYALQSVGFQPCSEICCELGDYFFDQEDNAEAIRWYETAASQTTSVLDARTSGNYPLGRLAECYRRLAEGSPSENYMELSERYRIQAEQWDMPIE